MKPLNLINSETGAQENCAENLRANIFGELTAQAITLKSIGDTSAEIYALTGDKKYLAKSKRAYRRAQNARAKFTKIWNV